MRRRPVVALLTLFACLLFGLIGTNAAHPFVLAARTRERNDDLEQQLKRLEIQNQNDLKELKALDTEQGTILAARKRGWVFPYERPLRVPQTAPQHP